VSAVASVRFPDLSSAPVTLLVLFGIRAVVLLLLPLVLPLVLIVG
jgi:hypothetical protein